MPAVPLFCFSGTLTVVHAEFSKKTSTGDGGFLPVSPGNRRHTGNGQIKKFKHTPRSNYETLESINTNGYFVRVNPSCITTGVFNRSTVGRWLQCTGNELLLNHPHNHLFRRTRTALSNKHHFSRRISVRLLPVRSITGDISFLWIRGFF